jgi:NAD(P)-dependent dehydrogenase (short-subunit alcohol dehydrogenase family)
MKRLLGKNIFVTGGSAGIGQAIVMAYAKEGANVVFSYRLNQTIAENMVNKIKALGQHAVAIHADFNQIDHLESVYINAKTALDGKLNVLVNNAAYVKKAEFIHTTLEQLQNTFTVNLIAPFRLSQFFCRDLIAKQCPGRIINVSSLSAKSAISCLSDYQSSKAALSMLTKSMAYEMAKHHIYVNTLAPGLTCTVGNQHQWNDHSAAWQQRVAHIPLGRAGQVSDHVGAAIYLASDEASWTTGSTLVIDGGQGTI